MTDWNSIDELNLAINKFYFNIVKPFSIHAMMNIANRILDCQDRKIKYLEEELQYLEEIKEQKNNE